MESSHNLGIRHPPANESARLNAGCDRGRNFWDTGANLGYIGIREYPSSISILDDPFLTCCLPSGIYTGPVVFGAA